MSYGSNLAVIAQDSALAKAHCVPTEIALGRYRSASIVFRTRVGAVILDSAREAGDRLTVFLEDGREYHCLKAAFGGDIPVELKEAIKHAVNHRIPVFLAVGVGRSGNPAPDFFCGISPFGRAEMERPKSGSTNF